MPDRIVAREQELDRLDESLNATLAGSNQVLLPPDRLVPVNSTHRRIYPARTRTARAVADYQGN